MSNKDHLEILFPLSSLKNNTTKVDHRSFFWNDWLFVGWMLGIFCFVLAIVWLQTI